MTFQSPTLLLTITVIIWSPLYGHNLDNNDLGYVGQSNHSAILSNSSTTDNQTTCDVTFCYNGGRCTTNNVTVCTCPMFYQGSFCEQLNLRMSSYETDSESVTLTWPDIIDMGGYQCLYLQDYKARWLWDQHWHQGAVQLIENAFDDLKILSIDAGKRNSLVLSGLKGDATEYVMCFIHEHFLPNISSPGSVMAAMSLSNSNCVSVMTSYEGGKYTVAAKYIALVMGLSVIVLFILRALVSCKDPNKRALIRDDIRKKIIVMKRVSSNRQKTKVDQNV